jgi:hypothetical protein
MASRKYRKYLVAGVVVAIVAAVFAVNWIYQVVRKPAEMFFPVSGALSKTPGETWSQYEAIFRRHSTPTVTPEFLAALAQVEGAGNPVARTPWRWRATSDPREVYRPASSAVGIRDHAVIEEGCWFNSLYMRVIPSHAVELTSAYLDRRVSEVLKRQRIAGASLEKKQDLAALIHLCGPAAGEAFAKRGFRLASGQRCGAHDARGYLDRVNAMKRAFARLSTFR